MTPPAIRKPLVEIPKKVNKNCPETVKTINVKKAIIVARRTIARRCSSLTPLVIVKKTGIVPNGFANVKNEVKHKRKNGTNESIITVFNLFISLP
jgi:hypothetical protein